MILNLGCPYRGRWVELDVVAESDVRLLFEWSDDWREHGLWHIGNPMHDFEVFYHQIRHMLSSTHTFMVRMKRTGQAVGLVQLYDVSLTNGWGFYFQYMAPRYRGHVYAAEAASIFMDQVFKQTTLRKVYADVFEYNDAGLRSLRSAGIREEGRFEAFVWHNDRYWDCFRLALDRAEWDILRERMIRLIDIEQYIVTNLQQVE